ncbi:MAG TPA: metallophosphoesterase [Candidatus Dormibacteraeota bacterium]|nr:metallophosphoesterase [Candidatus Dormibacteraeota bacterium]
MTEPIPGDPKRILVAGDTHGNWVHWQRVLLPAAHDHQVDGIVQLGDFGYWPLTSDGLDYLAWLSAQLDQDDSWVVFVDGNHEDHKALLQIPTRADGFVEITDRILWAPRGHRWVWREVRFLALGGAFSIDRAGRKLDSGRWGWFREETLTERQADKAKRDGPCDVLLTHEAPAETIPQLMRHAIVPGGYRSPEAAVSARLVQEVAETTKPKLLVHGHWHQFQQVQLPGHDTEVVGLSNDGNPQSWLVLELPTLAITHAPIDDQLTPDETLSR